MHRFATDRAKSMEWPVVRDNLRFIGIDISRRVDRTTPTGAIYTYHISYNLRYWTSHNQWPTLTPKIIEETAQTANDLSEAFEIGREMVEHRRKHWEWLRR